MDSLLTAGADDRRVAESLRRGGADRRRQSTLSRREDVHTEHHGERELRIPPREVLRLADVYRRRPINAVAGELLALARRRDVTLAEDVRVEVDAYFAGRVPAQIDRSGFLAEAKRMLPRALYEQVELACNAGVRDEAPELLSSRGHGPAHGIAP